MLARDHGPQPALSVGGLVRHPARLTAGELDRLPTTEARVPGREGHPDTVGRAFRLSEVLLRAGPATEATHVTCRSADGLYQASIPLDVLAERGLVMHTPDGPSPWRLVVCEGDTLCWNVKGLTDLDLTAGHVPNSVPDQPPH